MEIMIQDENSCRPRKIEKMCEFHDVRAHHSRVFATSEK